jgi:hypothetical protein
MSAIGPKNKFFHHPWHGGTARLVGLGCSARITAMEPLAMEPFMRRRLRSISRNGNGPRDEMEIKHGVHRHGESAAKLIKLAAARLVANSCSGHVNRLMNARPDCGPCSFGCHSERGRAMSPRIGCAQRGSSPTAQQVEEDGHRFASLPFTKWRDFKWRDFTRLRLVGMADCLIFS